MEETVQKLGRHLVSSSSSVASPTPAPSLFMLDDMTILVVGRDSDASNDDKTMTMDGNKSSMDVLAAIFFGVAATWLLIALLYAFMVLLFLRIRARGDLDRIYEADFGRFSICGTRYHVSLGWVLRRYIQHIHPHPHHPEGAPSRLTTRKERRDAMEVLLTKEADGSVATTSGAVAPPRNCPVDEETPEDGDGSLEGPVCSICLGEYEEDDTLLVSQTCSHKFHKECILDWLQRQNHADCPCCRVPMTDEEAVWKVVESMRDQAKGQKSRTKSPRVRAKSLTPSVSSSSSSYDGEADHTDQRSPGSALPSNSATTDLEALRNMTSCVSVSSAESLED